MFQVGDEVIIMGGTLGIPIGYSPSDHPAVIWRGLEGGRKSYLLKFNREYRQAWFGPTREPDLEDGWYWNVMPQDLALKDEFPYDMD